MAFRLPLPGGEARSDHTFPEDLFTCGLDLLEGSGELVSDR